MLGPSGLVPRCGLGPHSHVRLGVGRTEVLGVRPGCRLLGAASPPLEGSLGRRGRGGRNRTHSPVSSMCLQREGLGTVENCAHHRVEDTESIN